VLRYFCFVVAESLSGTVAREVGTNSGTARLQFGNDIIRNWWSDVLLKILNHLSCLFCLNTFPGIIYSAMYHFSLPKEPPLLQIRGIRARAFGKLVWRFFFSCCGCSAMENPLVYNTPLLFNNLEEGCVCILSVGNWKYFSGCWIISTPLLNKNSYKCKGIKIEVNHLSFSMHQFVSVVQVYDNLKCR